MTIHVEPSNARGVANHEAVSGIARWGATDWIVPGGTDLLASNLGLSGAPLNAAAISTSGLDVSIDTFEAFVGGAWLGSDDNTDAEHTHTLAGSSTTTTLYLGYDYSAADTIIFGPAGDFAAADPKIPVVDATDDGSSVTDTDDRRPIGQRPAHGILIDSTYDDDDTTNLSLDTGTLSTAFDQYDIVIYREDQRSDKTSQSYLDMRINGSASSNYHADIYDAQDNTHESFDNATEWQDIAGVSVDGSGGIERHGGFAYQVLRITCPTEIVSNSVHYPVLSTVEHGVGKNLNVIIEGVFASDTPAINALEVFGGDVSTGWIEIYGRGVGYGAEVWF